MQNQECYEDELEDVDELKNDIVSYEIGEDDMVMKKIDISRAEKSKIMKILEDDLKNKNTFLHEESFGNYQQILIISQISLDFINEDPFFRHITNVVKAIRRSLKHFTIDKKIVKNKEDFKASQDQLMRIFYQDINIGFITSTGQIKCTAFIFVRKDICSFFHKQIFVQIKKQRARITQHCFDPLILQKVPPQQQDYKNQFLRSNKFQNDYIVLKQEYSKLCEVIYHVYKPVDDQIYFVKKILLQSLPYPVHFSDIFNYNVKNESNPDVLRIHEAKILSRITHPNILRMYDWWLEQINFQTFLFMQYEYCTYPGLISQAKNLLSYSYFYMNPMPLQHKIKLINDILNQLINGLEYLQKISIVYEEIKPETLMVTMNSSGDLQVLLADFTQKQKCPLQTSKSPLKKEQPVDNTQSRLGSLILHLILTFPGDVRTRNDYVNKFNQIDDVDHSIKLFNDWAIKYVKNKHKEFSYANFKKHLQLAQKLLHSKFHDLQDIKNYLQII